MFFSFKKWKIIICNKRSSMSFRSSKGAAVNTYDGMFWLWITYLVWITKIEKITLTTWYTFMFCKLYMFFSVTCKLTFQNVTVMLNDQFCELYTCMLILWYTIVFCFNLQLRYSLVFSKMIAMNHFTSLACRSWP